jgi:signal transduction histidine kinase
METAAVRVEPLRDTATVHVDGLVTPALVADLQRACRPYRLVRCDLRGAHLSAAGANALRAWHEGARGRLELLLPDGVGVPEAPEAGPTPVDLPELLAHELRGPLSVTHLRLQTQAARLAAMGLEQEAQASRSALAGIEAVSRLFDTYLATSRPWRLLPVDLGAVACEAAAAARDLVGHGEVSVHRRPPDAAALVLGERQALHQLLWNLVRNALEAQAGPAEVQVVVEAPAGAAVRLSVSDRGPGFPPEVLEAPLRPRASRKAGGMGIGLIVCHWIVERHRGTIRLQNTPAGARVAVELPAPPPPDGPAAAAG